MRRERKDGMVFGRATLPCHSPPGVRAVDPYCRDGPERERRARGPEDSDETTPSPGATCARRTSSRVTRSATAFRPLALVACASIAPPPHARFTTARHALGSSTRERGWRERLTCRPRRLSARRARRLSARRLRTPSAPQAVSARRPRRLRHLSARGLRAPSARAVRAVSARRPRRLSAPSPRRLSAPSPRRLSAPSPRAIRAVFPRRPRHLSERCLRVLSLRAPSPRAVRAVSARRPRRLCAPSAPLRAPSAPPLTAPSPRADAPVSL